MMFTTYDRTTGQVISTVTDRRLAGGLPVIAGSWASSDYYIKNGRANRYPTRPPGYVKWNNDLEQWQPDPDLANRSLRQLRARALEAVDRVNPMWWAGLSPDRQTQLQAYRQALLDLPQQPGWPMEVIWPERPRWL